MVRKRDGSKEPWNRGKLLAGIRKAIVNRPVTEQQVAQIVDRIESRLRRKGPVVSSEQVGLEVLQQLQRLDQVAYMRFASVYKDFQQLTDFERELGILLAKKEPAKTRGR
jgi:transcriptional repressor NrdR